MTRETIQAEITQLLECEPVQEGLEALENVLPAIAVTYDEDARRTLPERLIDPLEAEDIYAKFSTLLGLWESSKRMEDMAARIDETYQAVRQRYEENMREVFAQLKPFERTARSLNLLYQNASGEVKVRILPVSATRFADSANPRHFDAMSQYLLKKFYEWKMAESPFYISFVGDIGGKSAMDKMATIAMHTRALAVVDIREMSTSKGVMEYAGQLQIAGIPAHLAHLVIPGTWVYAQGAIDVEFVTDEQGRIRRIEKQMAVPAAPALIGKLLEVRPGVFITGLEKEAIVGINGVRVAYDMERIDAKEWDKLGLIQIEPYGHIQGATTANKSNNADLRKFPKVDVANALLKDILQFCNDKAYSKWGERYKREFKTEIEIYLNRRMRQDLIEGYSINEIGYDEHEETVRIDISIRFFDVADEFDINLHGPKNGIDIVRKDQ